jgi:hypothetical protein
MRKMSPERCSELMAFLAGGPQTRRFVRLDPSSYAATFVGKSGGNPVIEDEIAFHQAFPNDAMPPVLLDFGELLPQLQWKRKRIGGGAAGTATWEETLAIPGGLKRRVVEDRPGGIPWLVTPAIRSTGDFDLIDFHADCVRAAAPAIAASVKKYPPILRSLGMMPGTVILSAFEVYWLVDYPDMPLYYMDFSERYLASVRKVHEANLALLDAMAGVGFQIFYTGSAGLELLSPRIFREAIVPFQREFNDRARELGVFTSYHICGHSRGLIEGKIIDDLQPTIFETCSAPPCGNNPSLRAAVRWISEKIITKGNLSLELLRNGPPDRIVAAVREIAEATKGRRHIIGQGDCTILDGTPPENLRTFLETVESLGDLH